MTDIPPQAITAAAQAIASEQAAGQLSPTALAEVALEAAAPRLAAAERELLAEAADALWESSKAALVVKPTLDVPYPDDPRWTPWTRWVEPKARQAHDVAMSIRKYLREQP